MYIGSDRDSCGILASTWNLSSCNMVMEKLAFMPGSSKHGNTCRAWVREKYVAAKYLQLRKFICLMDFNIILQ